MKRVFSVMLTLLVLNGSLFADESQKMESLLKKMVEVYGGKTALADAQNYIQHWRVVRAADKREGQEIRRVTLPSRLYVNLRYPDKSETRVLEGGVGIKIFGDHSKKQVFGPMLDAMKAQLMRLYTPLNLVQNSNNLHMSVKSSYYMLTLKKDGVESDYYVNPKNYHIEKTVGKLKMGNTVMEFVTLYKDFKRVGDILLPTTEIKYAGGVNTATNTLIKTKIVHLKKVDDHRYERI